MNHLKTILAFGGIAFAAWAYWTYMEIFFPILVGICVIAAYVYVYHSIKGS